MAGTTLLKLWFTLILLPTLLWGTAGVAAAGGTWSTPTSSALPTTNPLNSVAYGNGLWVVGGYANSNGTSTDGLTWNNAAFTGTYYSVLYNSNTSMWLMTGANGKVYTSSNAGTWTPTTVFGNIAVWGAAPGPGNTYVAVGELGNTGYFDGTGWSTTTNGALDLYGVTYGGGQFVTVGKGGKIYTSADGTSWTAQTSGVTTDLFTIAYANGLYVAGGSGGLILTSGNGATWTSRSTGGTSLVYYVAYGGGQWVAVGAGGSIYSSTNGTAWSPETSGTTEDLNWVAYGNGLWVAVGGHGTIRTRAGDSTPPVTTVSGVPGAPTKNNVTLTLSATDGGSGVANTYYILDGGTQQTGTSVTITAEGSHTLDYWSVDNVGNAEAPKSVSFKIDRTPPTISHALTPPANANGWNNASVSVSFTCADPGGSGVAACTGPTVVSAETAGQTVNGTATDAAGNTASDSVTVKVDKSVPTITGAAATAPIYNGWYAGNVAIHWTVNDTLSGIDSATVPADSVVTGEGGSLSASATVKDLAGNSATGSVNGIKIDRTAPGTSASGPPAGGASKVAVTVTLNATDTGSGVAATYYVLDGGSQQTGTSVTITGDGSHTLEYWSADNVGNVESPHHTTAIQIDGTPPTITHTLSTPANGAGWHHAPVTVTFACGDLGSGVASCTPPQTVSTEGKNQTITGTATDNAGNTATDSVTLNIDTTAPGLTITPDPAPNANGWNQGDVALTFACSDALSGVATCPPDGTISGEGVHDNDYVVTDVAGNITLVHSTIRIDGTAPALSGAAATPANGAGWYHGDVTVHWTADDALSGIAAAPPDSTITGEGTGLSASTSVTDKAGNSQSAAVTGINIDRTAPTLSGAVTAAPNANGWYNGDVTIHWTAADTLSGIAAAPADSVVTGEGSALSATTSVNDQAGNSKTATVGSIKIDRTAPVTTDNAPTGWRKADFTVTLTPADTVSGVANTYYTLDGGAQQSGTTVSIATEGAHTITYWSVDNADNSETVHTITVKLDKTTPTISGAADRAANANGWYNANVTVSFACADALSGVASCTSPVILGEGADQSATGTVADAAGNTGSATVSGISVDKTAPTLSGAATTPANGAGWYNGDVTIHWTAADALSGIDTAPADSVITGEGSALSASASVSDKAGNSTPATVGPIKIDRTAPVTTDDAPATWQKADFTVTLTPADALSGVANTYYTLDGGARQSGTTVAITTEGTHTVSYWSVDAAGNAETAHTVTVKLDKTAPTITGAPDRAPNIAGWYNADVTVHFTCADALSGVAGCPADAVLGEGANQQVDGTATDNAGNTASFTVSGINIDKTPPALAVLNPVDGLETNNPLPTFTGTAEPGSTVTVYLDDAAVSTLTADVNGDWSYQPAVTLPDATHTWKATAKDSADNETAAAQRHFTVDTVPPAVSLTPPTRPFRTLRPALTGTAEPGSTVSVTVDGAVIGTATAAGTFSVTPAAPLKEGEHTAQAQATDSAGNTGTSASVTFTIKPPDPVVPGPPPVVIAPPPVVSITSPANGQAVTKTITVSGTGTPDATVSVTVGGASLGSATVGTAGNWSVSGTVDALAAGENPIVATITDGSGQTGTPASVMVRYNPRGTLTGTVVDGLTQPVAGISVSVTDAEGHQITSVSTDAQGAFRVEGIPVGTYTVTAGTASARVVLTDGKTAAVTLVVTVARASVEGTVLGNAGKPVGGARVEVAEDFDGNGTIDFTSSMVTGPDGKYRFDVPRGNWTYHIKISLPVTIGDRTVTVDTTQTSDVGDVNSVGQGFVANRGIGGRVFVAGAPGRDPVSGSLGTGTQIRATIADANGNTTPLTVGSDGTYSMSNLAPGEYHVTFQVVAPDGQKLAGTISTVTVGQNGAITIGTPLIDPYGTVTDAVTGRPVAGVKLRLMWADTRLNRDAGRTPDTEVNLPALVGFAPNDNADPQMTDEHGTFAWMVFPGADYYLLGEKDGYQVYDSRQEGRNVAALPGQDSYVTTGIVHVGQTIVKYDLQMQPDGKLHKAFIKGYPDGTFQPESSVTRAEAATMLARALSDGSFTGTAAFSDVPATHWAAQSIAFVQARGLMVGDPGGSFRPDATITRAELAAIVTRIKRLQPAAAATFADVSGHWAAGVIEAARQAGLVTGFPDGGYHPEEPASRAQFTVVLARTLGRGTHLAGAAIFSDVPQTYWAAGFIEEASVDHIMKGLNDGAETW